MENAPLLQLQSTARPTTVTSVLEWMHAIEAAIPATSGVAVFNRLYRWTTEQVDAGLTANRFEDGPAMASLDVTFANLYFDAVDAWARGQKPPGAWRPLFEREDNRHVLPLNFALAGMSAHINRDLAIALARHTTGPLHENTPQFRDYLVINQILGETSDQIRDRILPKILIDADHALGTVDDKLVLRVIATARRAAWEVAERLYDVRGIPPLFDAAVTVLDVSAGATARAILDPEAALGA